MKMIEFYLQSTDNRQGEIAKDSKMRPGRGRSRQKESWKGGGEGAGRRRGNKGGGEGRIDGQPRHTSASWADCSSGNSGLSSVWSIPSPPFCQFGKFVKHDAHRNMHESKKKHR